MSENAEAQTPRLSAEQRAQFIHDGYIKVSGLIPEEVVARTRENLLDALGIEAGDPATWEGKNVPYEVHALTVPCRTEAVEQVAEELVGPGFVRGLCHSPYMEAKGVQPPTTRGYIPVLNFPRPGPRAFTPPGGYHIDGAHLTTLWPDKHFLVVFAYLTDVAEYGGATTILPGSHRQAFAYWVRENHPGSTTPPALKYADPVPQTGLAGDVIFMHYLTVHSGSPNHSDQIRVGLNTAVLPDSQRPYQRKSGPPQPDWTPLDWTLRTDTLE